MADLFKARFKESLRIKLLIGLLTVALIVFMFPKAESLEFEVLEGTVWIHDDLIAPFSYPILKPENIYREEIERAKRNIYPVYFMIQSKANNALDSFTVVGSRLAETFSKAADNQVNSKDNSFFLSDNAYKTLFNVYRRGLNDKANKFEKLLQASLEQLRNIYKIGVIQTQSAENLADSIAVRVGSVDIIESSQKYFDTNTAKSKLIKNISNLEYTNDIVNAISEFAEHFIIPNIIYSAEFTNAEILQAQGQVSKYSGIVNENERIIAKHERVTKEVKLRLDSFRAAKGEKFQDQGLYFQHLGKFLHIASLISLLTIYFYNFRKKIFNDNVKLLIFALMFVFISFVTYLINQASVPVPLQFLIFIPAASMIITIIFDSRVGFYSTVIISLITAALRGNDYSFAVLNLFAGALGVYTVRDIKNRSQIFRSFFFILIGYSIGVFAFGLERFAPINTVLLELAFAATNAVISPVLTYGLLIFFEKLFNITTDLTLLELSNFDRPLLRELSRKAPGTFNHSLTMGTIAEAAAEKIGANALLTRVGAYYHDIGKILRPKNYAENQLSEDNIHEEVNPQESVELIKKHVEDGMILGKQHNLPTEVIDFIPMHHGTLVMKYFFEKAKEKYSNEIIDPEEYKYTGPVPNSKETAIVMLADGCESAVRSIKDPDQEKIENVVDNIINDRIENGQLRNSPVTLQDIDHIKESFKNILIGQHHKRIRYPNQDEIEKGIDEEQNE